MRDKRTQVGLFLAAALFVLGGLWYSHQAPAAGVGPEQTPTNIQLSGTVTPAWTTIGATGNNTVRLAGRFPFLSVQVLNTTDGNDVAVTGFRLQYRTWPGGNWITRWADTDWADSTLFGPDDFLGYDSDSDGNSNGNSVHELAAGEYCGLDLHMGPWDAIRFQAKVASAAATISVRGMAK